MFEPSAHLDVPALAALERRAVDRSIEIDGDAIVDLRGRARRLLGIGPALLSDPVDRGLDIGRIDIGDRTLKRNLREIADFEHRQHLERDLEVEVAAGLERRVDRRLIGRQLDLWLPGEAQAVVVDDLLVRCGDGFLHHVGHHRLAVDLPQVLDRHLSRTEAVDPDLRLQFGQLPVELVRQVARRQRYVIFALEPLAQRLSHLHLAFRLVVAAMGFPWPKFLRRPIVNGSGPPFRAPNSMS